MMGMDTWHPKLSSKLTEEIMGLVEIIPGLERVT